MSAHRWLTRIAEAADLQFKLDELIRRSAAHNALQNLESPARA